jgi:hypothetical protein
METGKSGEKKLAPFGESVSIILANLKIIRFCQQLFAPVPRTASQKHRRCCNSLIHLLIVKKLKTQQYFVVIIKYSVE